MLRELPWRQFVAWKRFDIVSPFSDHRADWHAASICAMIANTAIAGRGGMKRFDVEDFLLEFGPPKLPTVMRDEREEKAKAKLAASSRMKFLARKHAAFANAELKKKRR